MQFLSFKRVFYVHVTFNTLPKTYLYIYFYTSQLYHTLSSSHAIFLYDVTQNYSNSLFCLIKMISLFYH